MKRRLDADACDMFRLWPEVSTVQYILLLRALILLL